MSDKTRGDAGAASRPAPVIVKAAGPSANQTISQASVDTLGMNMAQVSTWQASITTTTTCDIDLSITLTCQPAAAGNVLYFGYQVDSETPVCLGTEYWAVAANQGIRTVTVRDVLENRAAGTYVVKVMASRATGNVTIFGTTNNSTKPNLILEAFPVS